MTEKERRKRPANPPSERLQSFVEELPDSEVHAGLRFVEYLRREASDPVARALRGAPFDDEPLTADDIEELEAAERDRQDGRSVSHRRARRDLLRGM